MKNDILKISGVSFSKCSRLWSVPAASDNFPRFFEYFDERMQKESPWGSRKCDFGYSSKPNLEDHKNDEKWIFLIGFKFHVRAHPGAHGTSRTSKNILRMTRRAYFIGSVEHILWGPTRGPGAVLPCLWDECICSIRSLN